MDQTNNKPKEEIIDNKDEQNSLHPLNQVPPAQSEPADSGAIESETNYSTMNNKSEENNASISESDSSEKETENVNKIEITLPVSIQLNNNNEPQQKPEPIKTEEASIQVGGDKKMELLKNTEGTYAPEQCIIHSQSQKKSQNQATNQNSQKVGIPDDDNKENKTTEVQIQVGISLVDEPEKLISKAKQQRVLVNHEGYLKYLENYLKESKNQKLVLDDCYDEINKKRIALYSLYNVFKQYFKYYASFTKDFYQKCEKVQKEEKIEQMNKFLNIGVELKDGFDELAAFKRQTGDNYKIVYQFITTKVLNDLDEIYNKYVNSMNEALGQTNQKRNITRKIEQDFKKQGTKVQKMFNRLKQGKKQQQDFFIQLLKTIALERQYKQSIIQWGKQLIQTRKLLVDLSQTCIIDIQFLLNNFKNQTNILYGIQSRKSELIRKSRAEVEEQTHFAKLITLADSDYIRSSLQLSLRKQVPQITDIAFAKFIQMPHFSHFGDQSIEFLQNMIVKTFSLKQPTEELVNTVSGRLVLYHKDSLQCKSNIFVKHIKSATPMQDGVVEIELKVPGIIFSSKKATKIEFKDNDRAEQLICFLGQGQANNS